MTSEDILQIIAWPVLVAFATFLYNRKLAMIKSILALHAEFHTESFLKARIRADELLQEHLVQGKHFRLADLHDLCKTAPNGAEDWAYLSQVLHFFERLNAMQLAGITDRKTLARLLGSYVNYYHSMYFQRISVESGDWENLGKSLRAVKSVV